VINVHKTSMNSKIFLALVLIPVVLISELLARMHLWISPIIGYLNLYFNIVFFGLLLLITLKRGSRNVFLPILYVLAYSFINRALLYFYTPWDRDSPSLLSTVRIVEQVGLDFTSVNLSERQFLYLQHPGLQIFGLVTSKLLGIEVGEELIYLFLLLSTITIPIFIYLLAKSLYDNSHISLIATFLASTINIFIMYESFSRGMLGIPLMLCLLILISKVFKSTLASRDIISIIILTTTLTQTHDFTASLLLLYVSIYLILPIPRLFIHAITRQYGASSKKYYEYHEKPHQNRFYAILLLILAIFLVYEIYRAMAIINVLKNTLLESFSITEASEALSRPRNIRQILTSISRILFWLLSGIIIMLHFYKGVHPRCEDADLVLATYSVLLILISIITGFLPVRIWYYSYTILLILLAHIILIDMNTRSSIRKIIAILLLFTFIISNINSLSPLHFMRYQVNEEEYRIPCDYTYTWSHMELFTTEYVYKHLPLASIVVIGDLGVKLLFSQYPVDVLITPEPTSRDHSIAILFWRLPDMDYVFVYKTASCTYIPSNYRSLIMQNYSIILTSDSTIVFKL